MGLFYVLQVPKLCAISDSPYVNNKINTKVLFEGPLTANKKPFTISSARPTQGSRNF